MQGVGKFKMNINAIPNNIKKYMSFMLGRQLVFLDSFQFMSSSLDNLSKNLPDEAFKYTSEEFKDEKLRIMKTKGYTFTTTWTVMKSFTNSSIIYLAMAIFPKRHTNMLKGCGMLSS